MICTACKNHLAQFYLMKQQASKHMKPPEVRKLEIISLVKSFLDSTVADCIVTEKSNLLAIHPDTRSTVVEEQLEICSSLLDNETQEDLIAENYTVIDVKPEAANFDNFADFELTQVEEPELVYTKDLESIAEPVEIRKFISSPVKPEVTSIAHTESPRMMRVERTTAVKRNSTDDSTLIGQKLWIGQQLESQKRVENFSEGLRTVWNCSQCQFVTNKRSRFRIHLQKNHTAIVIKGPSKHSCFDCHLRFDGESHLIVHNNCHRIFDVIAPFVQYPECGDCRMFFISGEDYSVHKDRHENNIQSLRDPIPILGVVYRNGELFTTDDEEPPENFDENSPTCGHCLQKFESDNDCKNHLMLHHATSFTCPFDSRVFSGIPTLSFGNHLRQCHPEVFPDLEIACSFCKMQFETVYEKLAHMKICKAKAFQCDHCDRSFFRKSCLLQHLKVVTGLIIFACHSCGKRCKDQGDLKTHMRCHTNVRPYPCPHCDKAYKTSSARASHVESHMDQVHVCAICSVKFRRRILYQRHMKLIHDESYRQKCFAENTCKICNKSYLRKTHYQSHLKTHNSG